CWQMKEHDGWLYAGTWDQGNLLAGVIYDSPAVLSYFTGQSNLPSTTLLNLNLWLRLTESGGDIFKTQDGINWFPITQDGLGNRNNYGWRTMLSTPDGYFYLGSANPTDGLEIWRAGGPPAKK